MGRFVSMAREETPRTVQERSEEPQRQAMRGSLSVLVPLYGVREYTRWLLLSISP